ncbi:MAG: uncharacterized protein JWP25_8982 [Bradyrhizobium sp.]|nr:uncharacterized protein [Bradyrhizobium sp.]
MNFDPVRTKADLDTLDHTEIMDGYRSAERGDPEPGPNRGRAFWHGWRNRMIDYGVIPMDAASHQLACEVVGKRHAHTQRPPRSGA